MAKEFKGKWKRIRVSQCLIIRSFEGTKEWSGKKRETSRRPLHENPKTVKRQTACLRTIGPHSLDLFSACLSVCLSVGSSTKNRTYATNNSLRHRAIFSLAA